MAAMAGRGGAGRAHPRPRCAAEIRGRLPSAAAGHVRGDSPARAALARCARRLSAAERGIRRPGGPGAATWLAGDATGEPPPRAADRPAPGRRIAGRAAQRAPDEALVPPRIEVVTAALCGTRPDGKPSGGGDPAARRVQDAASRRRRYWKAYKTGAMVSSAGGSARRGRTRAGKGLATLGTR